MVLSLAIAAAAPAANYTWVPSLGAGSWYDAANWQIAGTAATQPPGTTDLAAFTTIPGTTPTTAHTVSLTTPVTVAGLTLARTALTFDVPVSSGLNVTAANGSAALVLTSGVLNAAGSVTTNQFTYNGGQVLGTIDIASTVVGRLSLTSSAVTGGQFRLNGGGDVYGGANNSSGTVPSGVTITGRAMTNVGSAQLRLVGQGGGMTNSGTITLDAAATVANSQVNLVNSGSFSTLTNYGTINLNAGGTGTNTRTVTGQLFNSFTGTLNVADGVTANGTDRLSNDGQLNVASGATLTVPQFTQNNANAVTTLNGRLISPDVSYYGGTINGTIELAGNNVSNTRQLYLGTNSGTAGFVFTGGGTISANNGLGQAMSATVRPTAAGPSVTLKYANSSFTNNGTITLADTDSLASSTIAVTSDSGTSGSLYNYGTLNLNAGSTGSNVRTITGSLQNNFTGKTNVASGVTANVTQSINNDGQLTIASGASLTALQFTQNNSNAVTNIGGTLTAPYVSYYGGQINGVFELAGTDFSGTRQLILGTSSGTAAFVMQGGGTINASNGLGQAMTLTARPVSPVPAATLKFNGSSFTNNGTINLDGNPALTNSNVTLASDSSSASFYNYGTLNLNAGSSGANNRTVTGGLQNNFTGKLNIAGGVTANVTQSLNNDGQLTIASGASLTAQQFTQNNSNAVTNIGGTITSPYVSYYGGQINGIFELAGTDFSGTRQLILGTSTGTANFVMQGAGTINTSNGLGQAMTVTARAIPGIAAATLKASGSSFTNNGTINLTADSAVANSTITLTSDSASTSFYNYGTLNLNAGGTGTNTRTITGGLQNNFTGKLNVASGVAANVTQSLNNDGLLTIATGASVTAQQFTQNNSNAVTTISGTLTTPYVSYYGGQLNGVVELAGTDFSNSRQLIIGTSNGTGTFVMQGAGTLNANGGLPQAINVTARAIPAIPTATLKVSGSGFTNNGTITLVADSAVANSSVTLISDGPSASFYNYGTLNLNAGGTGTNTRAITGGLQNNFTGKLNVASGVTATVSQSLNNDGLLNIASGATLTAQQFSQNNSNAVTTVNGTLIAPEVSYYGGTINGIVTLAGTNFAGTRRVTLGTPNGTAGFVLRGGGEVSMPGNIGGGISLTGRATAATPTATLKIGTSTTAMNSGTITVDADPDVADSVVVLAVPGYGGNDGWLYNSGTVNFNAGGTGTNTRQFPGTLNNNPGGTINVNATTTVGGTTSNRGTMNLNAAATFVQSFTNETGGVLNIGVTPTFQNGFTNYGTLNVSTPPAPPNGSGTPAPVEVPYPIGGNGAFTQSGSGTVILSGANTYTGETSVANPSATLVATPAAYQNVLTNAGGLDVKAGAFVFQYDTAAPGDLPAAVRNALRNAAEAPAPSPVQQIRSLLVAAHASNFTTGQIRSSTASATRGLGYVDDGDSVTLKATLYGDADLDGGVSINDFNALATSFGQSSGKVWVSGDFDYDGGVSINDFNLLAGNFGKSLTGPAAAVDYGGLLAFAAAHNDLAAFEAATGVPEPTGVAALTLAATIATRRRRA